MTAVATENLAQTGLMSRLPFCLNAVFEGGGKYGHAVHTARDELGDGAFAEHRAGTDKQGRPPALRADRRAGKHHAGL